MLPKQLRFLHPYLHATGLLLMVVGLPFSMLLMSLSQFFIGGNWILEGDYVNKWKRFRSSKVAILLTCLFLIYLPTIFWSSNVDESLKMLRINLPLLIFPFVMGSSNPLPASWYYGLIRIFILSVFLSALTCSIVGLPQWINGSLTDIRHISLFISHIRFALLIVFAVFLAGWILIYRPFQITRIERIAYLFTIAGLLVFMVVLQSLNGFAVMFFVGLLWLFVEAKGKLKPVYTNVLTGVMIAAFLLTAGILLKTWNEYFTPARIFSNQLPRITKAGNPYTHNLDLIENGSYIDAFVCESELRNEWPKFSKMPLDSFDLKGHRLLKTLIRYLNSKGLTKDSVGMHTLSKGDIQHIEKGMANFKYAGLWGLRMRFYQIMYEYAFYQAGGKNASGHTFLMKLEFWKAGANIAFDHPVFGVGIGDVPDEFNAYYERTNSWLSKDWRLTCHNQYLYFAVAGGFIMLITFVLIFLMALKIMWHRTILPFKLFIGIISLAMLTEDMLTTQAGVSLVAFFFSFFAFGSFKIVPSQGKDQAEV
jgi:hypothetical protein